MSDIQIYITPQFDPNHDRGDGGIRRVVEAQHKYLPMNGVTCVDSEEAADLIAMHAGSYINTIKPIIAHVHGLYWNDYQWERWCYQANNSVLHSIHDAVYVTAPSEWVANAIRRNTWRPTEVLYHGIEPNEWEPVPTNEIEWYCLWNKTRVDPVCDMTPLIDLANMAKDDSNVKFVSTYGNPTQNLLIQRDLDFTTAKQVLRKAGVYLATTRETFGIGTLEAMAAGVPILGFDWGGQAEFVKHLTHGYLAKPGDIKDLYEGLKYCIANRSMLGEACRQTVLDQFTWEQIIPKYADIYKRFVQPSAAAEDRTYVLNAQSNIAQSNNAQINANTQPLVSIIVPTYNLGQYLPDCIDSILAQDSSYENYEVIIVDDASTDSITPLICDQQAERDIRISVIHNSVNLYLAGSLNTGIRASYGEYILPLDADNMIARNTLFNLASLLTSDRSVDISYGAMRLITPEGEIDEHFGEGGVSTWPGEFNLEHQLKHANQIPSTSMYRRNVWLYTGGYRRRCRTAEDAEFWTRATSVGFVPKRATEAVTLVYRNRADSMSHVNADWDWTAWFPWSIRPLLRPGIISHTNVQTYDPIQISIVIPVGPGHHEIVMDAVDSIIAQTHQKWEIIVVNDSGKALPEFPTFVRVFNTPKPGSGPAIARNIGIRNSKAPTFLLLDADDYIQPETLEKLYSIYRRTGKYVYCDWVVNETQEAYKCFDYDCSTMFHQMLHSVTALYTKEAWEDVGGFDETIEAWEDWDYLLALASKGHCGIHYEEPLLHYRLSTGTLRESMHNRKEELKSVIYNKWADYIEGRRDMGCSACGGGNVVPAFSIPPTAQTMMEEQANTSGMTLLEFAPPNETGVMTFNGRYTGTPYRVGSDPDHKKVYVYNEDLYNDDGSTKPDSLLNISGFKLADDVRIPILA